MPNVRYTPGAVLLRLRQKYGHGIRTAYYRDRVRPRILETSPVECGQDPRCEIHVLTSAGDWLNLMWALKSFYCYSNRRYKLCIHDDGSLGTQAVASLLHHFPGARMIDRAQANHDVNEALGPYPQCLRFRQWQITSPKLFDFIQYLTAERMLVIDSDILFFAQPSALLDRIENPSYRFNSVNPDISSAYTLTPETVKAACGVDLVPRFNCGLGLIHRQSMRFDWIEEFLAIPGIDDHFWRVEQTIYALCGSRFGTELLPEEYAVRFDAGADGLPCRHYVGVIRHLMYAEGMRKLLSQGFLGLC